MAGRTKDESFMLRLYDEASKLPEMDGVFDRYEIGRLVGMQAKAVDTICNTLAQTNFIKKYEGVEISITPHGMKLVEGLRGKR